MSAPGSGSAPRPWLTRPTTIRRMWWVGSALLVALTLADLVIRGHPVFGIDSTFGFYCWYGLGTCALMVLVAKGLGVVLKREDTYYDVEL